MDDDTVDATDVLRAMLRTTFFIIFYYYIIILKSPWDSIVLCVNFSARKT